MEGTRLEQASRHLMRLETRWAAAVVPVSARLWRRLSHDDPHHRLGYRAPGESAFGKTVVFCPALIVARTDCLDDFWFDDYLCTVETHLTLHAEGVSDENEVQAEMSRLAPDSSLVAMLVEAGAV